MAQRIVAAPGASPADKGLATRISGVITSPRETFPAVVDRPRWFGVLAITALVVALCAALPLTTEAGKQAALDQNVRWTESFTGTPVSDAQYDQMSRRMGNAPLMAGGMVVLSAPIWLAIIAVLLWAVCNAAMGGDASYKQVFALAAHAGVISTLGAIYTGVINYVQGTAATSAANLRVLLPMVEENSFAGRVLGAVDLFMIWWLFVLAIGLAVLYKRRTQPIAVTLLAVYALFAVAIAAVAGRSGGGA